MTTRHSLRFLFIPFAFTFLFAGPSLRAASGSDDTSAGTPRTQADVYITAKGTSDRLTKKDAVPFATLDQPDEHIPTIILDKDKTFQTIVGIGGALTDASAETFYKLPSAQQKEILTALFDKVHGNGFSLGRTHIHSCDFSSSSYAYAEPGDVKLERFTVAHDRIYRIPFIKAALAAAGHEMTLFASPWSPPAWMKSNNDMLHGGKLLPKYRQTWADYFVKFVQEYKKEGLSIWGLTVQNEPMAVQRWESCIFTAVEERDFVKQYLGPTLQRAGLSNLRLMIWDHNRGIMYQRAKVVFDDPEAAQYVWGTGMHWYVGDHFDNVRLVHDAYPTKEIFFTEGTEAEFDASKVNDWEWGEVFGNSLIHDLNNWASGWTAWNVLLDEQGGPNHVGNLCMAPIIADTKTGALTYMNSFWYLGHFSKFIRPGARRIVCSSNADELQATAFLNTDGKIAVVVMNRTEKEIEFDTWIENASVVTKSPAHSIVTLVF
jgi:glucosylceramidase